MSASCPKCGRTDWHVHAPKSKRWVVECIWSGYRSSQERPCHRRVYSGRPKYRKQMEAIHTVQFTDGTTMSVAVRDALPREKVKEINGYTSLLDDFIYRGMSGWVSVWKLHETKEEEKASREVQNAS